MKKIYRALLSVFLLSGVCKNLPAQTSYFVDGFHGGIYGHYPLWVTKFMTDTLQHYKDWKINLEIEPETWDTVALKDPSNYAVFQKLLDNSENPVEYVNPAYGQSYLYNISAESIIRQFQYGMRKLKEHFPGITFTTYSTEEPCFTSALPQILKSLGFKYASLKNPNTCWGGYVRAYGGESLNWIGPDGTSILTVPRYASEELQKKSTWQTTAWNNSHAYINASIQQGITDPVGMCLQDAGWKNGRWLGKNTSAARYTTWRDYFNLIEKKQNVEDWRLSQEDIQVSLVWGSQVLQRIAQQVRQAENKITMAEKAAALAKLYANVPYPQKEFDEAWRTLMLAQHHDCWIVPYNKQKWGTWTDNVKVWTGNTISASEKIIQHSLQALNKTTSNQQNIVVYNATAFNRNEIVEVKLPADTKHITDGLFNSHNTQLVTGNDSSRSLLVRASAPALGYSVLSTGKHADSRSSAVIRQLPDGTIAMETDLYKLVINPAEGGRIQQLIAKTLGNKDFVDANNTNGFNTLRGNFYTDGGFKTSKTTSAKVTIIENGPLRIGLKIESTLSNAKFIQTIRLTQGERLIDCSLHLEYSGRNGIGEDFKQQGGFNLTDLHKAFYNDTCKLIATFPLNLQHQKVYKDAPLDVTESKLSNTFYNSWDSIKNNIINNWVDVTDGATNYGMAIFSDHVTSYSHGANFPLALTMQYAGVGLWGRDYTVDGPSDIRYALLPHKGKWDAADLNNETIKWNEPLTASFNNTANNSLEFISHLDSGIAVSAMYYNGDDLYVRLVNNGSKQLTHKISFNCYADEVDLVELNNTVAKKVKNEKNEKVAFECEIPVFGIRTVRMKGARAN
ncbi:glycosyl hydrolase [Danxiaibacter flavus]|uniref:Glycosyl hydrolase n=1 Tax=Danxiaibacter flavus TaxID=3049108 RepID=A0ABV3ZP91_9BACT|nr:glycosyl hydrolase [Chitinophagaceae bacterium DXS]